MIYHDVRASLGCEFGSCYREPISSTAEAISEKEDVWFSLSRDGRGPKKYTLMDIPGL